MILNLVQNEILKIFANRKIYAFLVVQLAIAFVPVIGTLIVKVSTFDGQTYPLFLLALTSSWVIPIFLVVLIADILTDELANGTLSLSLIHPVTRGELLAAKVLSILVIIVFLLLFTMLLGYSMGTIVFGWGTQFIYKGIVYNQAHDIILTLNTYLSTAVPLIGFSILVMFLALIFSSSGAVVGVSIGLIMLFALISHLLPNLEPFLITTYFSSFANSVVFTRNYSIIMTSIKIMALYIIAFYTASVMLLQKRDLTD